MKNDLWMPFYIGDYLADTLDLTKAEHGSYMLAIFAYWKNRGPLPSPQFQQITGREFPRVARFFTLHEGFYSHKRVDLELQRRDAIAAAAKAKADKGVAARRAQGLLPPL